MKTEIEIKQVFDEPSWRFHVIIRENGERTKHSVSMSKDFYASLNTNVEPWKVIRESFEFLLEKEPKESILPEFDITIISYYFPEFKEELERQLREESKNVGKINRLVHDLCGLTPKEVKIARKI